MRGESRKMPLPKVDKDLKTEREEEWLPPSPAPIVVIAEKVRKGKKSIAAKCHHEREERKSFRTKRKCFCVCVRMCTSVKGFAMKMQNVCIMVI
jgi:hypothetical protein